MDYVIWGVMEFSVLLKCEEMYRIGFNFILGFIMIERDAIKERKKERKKET